MPWIRPSITSVYRAAVDIQHVFHPKLPSQAQYGQYPAGVIEMKVADE